MADTGGHDNFGDPWELVDKATEAPKASWWRGLDDGRRAAWSCLLGAGAFGVLGVPLISILLEGGSIPLAKHFVAALWLIVITLPVAAGAGTVVYLAGKVNGPTLLILGAAAAVLGVGLMGAATDQAGGSLAGFYCYNDGTVLEEQCREFDELGFYSSAQAGTPGQNADLLAKAFVFTADARGLMIALSGLVAGASAGYLIRRESAPE